MISRAVMIFALSIATSVTACGGQTVEPLDPQDPTLPQETRQWLADAEDGVLAARAQRDVAIGRLRETEDRVDEMEDKIDLSGGATGALGQMLSARVKLAELRVAHAEAALTLTERKYELANAERAVLHDRAQYDLAPLRQITDEARKEATRAMRAVEEQRRVLAQATNKWWAAYSSLASGGGNTISFWIGDAEPISAPASRETDEPAAPAPQPEAATSGGEGSEDEAESESGEE